LGAAGSRSSSASSRHRPCAGPTGYWAVEALISAPIIFGIEVVSLCFARALFVWFYNVTASSVLLVAIFHASFDGAITSSPTTSCRRRTR
jgi:hypothetical protein